jgi:hydroxymethylpyrimidine pyrophosphatase-like HAD family hydrolase
MIRLVVLDIDGCLTGGEAKAWDFGVFDFIARLNRGARAGKEPFAVTLCTGRPEPYVEAVTQAIEGHLPAIYENGAGLYFPAPYRFAEHPDISPDMRAAWIEIRRILKAQIVAAGIGLLQPGKESTITLYPAQPSITLEALAGSASAALGSALDGYVLFVSRTSVEILPQGIDKGAGLAWLTRETGIEPSEMGGIGDSNADLAYLLKTGSSAAPANAVDEVKTRVQYVSPHDHSRGVKDILERWRRQIARP